MVQFKKGMITVGPRDFIKCPFCKRVKVDEKISYSRVTLVSATVLPTIARSEHRNLPYLFPLLDEGPSILLPTEPERVAYDGPGLQIHLCCEQGHEWAVNMCMHGDRAIQFIEVIDALEPELEEAEIAEEEDEDDE